jgi:hypothetical protein
MENHHFREQEVQPVLDDLFGRFRFARAVELAAHGKTREAEAILRADGSRPRTPDELDLLARMAAKKKRFDEARSLWLDAVRLAPENRVYVECSAALAEAERDARRRTIMTLFSGVTLLAVAACSMWWFLVPPRKPARHLVPAHPLAVPGQNSTVRPNSTNSVKPAIRHN